MLRSAGLRILEFVSGYIEFIFVPPFIGEWQQLTAERSVAHARRQTHSRLVTDIKNIDRHVRSASAQLDMLIDVMREQENAIRSLGGSPTDREQQKTLMATYCVHAETVRKLREIVHIMARVKAELMVRITVLQTAKDAVSLNASYEYVSEFSEAAGTLFESEKQTAQMMDIMYQDTDTDRWNDLVQNFIKNTGNYAPPPHPPLLRDTAVHIESKMRALEEELAADAAQESVRPSAPSGSSSPDSPRLRPERDPSETASDRPRSASPSAPDRPRDPRPDRTTESGPKRRA